MTFTNKTFTNQTLPLDGNDYQGCTFVNCKLTYAGGKYTLSENSFVGYPDIIFQGCAMNTLNSLAAFYTGGFRDIVEATLNNIRKGSNPELPPAVDGPNN